MGVKSIANFLAHSHFGFDAESRVALARHCREVYRKGLELWMRLGQVEPLSQYLVRNELRVLASNGGVVFARRADKKAIPGLFSAGNSEVQTAVQVCCIEAEEFSQNEAWIVLERFEDPEERILWFDSGFHVQLVPGCNRGLQLFSGHEVR